MNQYLRKNDWVVPVMICVMTMVFGVLDWQSKDILNSVRNNIQELKVDNERAHEKIWTFLSNIKTREDCITQDLAKCCYDKPGVTNC